MSNTDQAARAILALNSGGVYFGQSGAPRMDLKGLQAIVRDYLDMREILQEFVKHPAALSGSNVAVTQEDGGNYSVVRLDNQAEQMREAAIQQLTGFDHAQKGYTVIQLVEAMGMTPDEWADIKTEATWLNAPSRTALNEYF